jgi:hypothetical protein
VRGFTNLPPAQAFNLPAAAVYANVAGFVKANY